MTFTVDLRHHMQPDFFWQATNSGDGPVGGVAPPRLSRSRALGLPDSLVDFPADTTRAVAQLLYSNTFDRTPDVKYILSHAGGTVPYLAGRFAVVAMGVISEAHDRSSAAASSPELSDAERTAVLGATAATLIPRLARRFSVRGR